MVDSHSAAKDVDSRKSTLQRKQILNRKANFLRLISQRSNGNKSRPHSTSVRPSIIRQFTILFLSHIGDVSLGLCCLVSSFY